MLPTQETNITHCSFVIVLNSKVSPKVYIPVETLREASNVWLEYSEKYALGASNLLPDSGIVFHPISGLFARISYNGRIWHVDAPHYAFDQSEIDLTYIHF